MIDRRFLTLLLAPAMLLAAVGAAGWMQLRQVDEREARLFDGVAPRLAAIATLGRDVATMEASVDAFVAAEDSATRVSRRARFAVAQGDAERLFSTYADSLVADDSDRRQVRESREGIERWTRTAAHVFSLSDSGDRTAVTALARDSLAALSESLAPRLVTWTAYHRRIAESARNDVTQAIHATRVRFVIAIVVLVTAVLTVAVLLWRQILQPIRGLEATVALISGGTYALRVPHMTRRDEIGSLARSIDALRLASFALENERWTRDRVARIVVALQSARTAEDFGATLLSELIPMLGGGAGSLSVAGDGDGNLRRAVAYGVAPDTPEPAERATWPFESSDGRLLGVVDLATERLISERERALLVALMPQVAMLLELLRLRGAAFPPSRALPA